MPALPLDLLPRILAFAGMLHVSDVLCHDMRRKAMAKRLLHTRLYLSVIDDALPRSAFWLAADLGWRGPRRMQRFFADSAELFDMHAASVLRHERETARRRRAALSPLWLHTVMRIRMHLHNNLEYYTEGPQCSGVALRRYRESLFEDKYEHDDGPPFRDVSSTFVWKRSWRLVTYRFIPRNYVKRITTHALALVY